MPEADGRLGAQGGTCCPRCGGEFRCGAGDTDPCACTRIALDAAALAGLRERYAGCLCLRCLTALANERLATPARGRID